MYFTVPGEKLSKHGENMQTSHRNSLVPMGLDHRTLTVVRQQCKFGQKHILQLVFLCQTLQMTTVKLCEVPSNNRIINQGALKPFLLGMLFKNQDI